MDNTGTTETERQAARLLAENESLKQLLQEEQQVAAVKNFLQRELETKASEGAAIKSYFDLQAEELKLAKSYVNELMQKAEAAAERETELEKQVSLSVNTSYQLEDVRTKYNYLTAQLNDLTETLQQLSIKNTLQMQYAGRIAELESKLANAAEEIDMLKNQQQENTAT
jgi:hypothetical protein